MVKFVHNDRRSSNATKVVVVAESSLADNMKGEVVRTRRGTFVNLGSRHMPEGSTYQSMRLVERLRPGPTTTADRIAVRLVGYFDKNPRDPSVVITYFKLLAQLFGQSAAFSDSVALFCSCWSCFQHGVPDGYYMDYNLYGKALRSHQRALNNPTEQLSCETLAATTILDRTEIFFDGNQRHNKAVHVAGIVASLAKRGPPKLNDDLDIHLALENQGRLVSFLVANFLEN